MTKNFLKALKGETCAKPPFWFMRQAGRYLPEYMEIRKKAKNFLDFCYTPELAVEATLQPIRRYGMDAAILFSDILVLPDALGCDVAFEEGRGPVLEPIVCTRDIEKLNDVNLLENLSPVFKTLRSVKAALAADVSMIGFAGAPWTVAVYMVEGRGGTDGGTVRRWAYEDEKGFARLIDLLATATAAYLIEQIKNGAEAVQLFDSWANMLPESQFNRWVITPTRTIVNKIKDIYPYVPIIGFPRAAGVLFKPFVEETGVDGISIDCGVPLDWAASMLQSQCTVQGNLDNQLLAVGGQALEKAAKRILGRLAGGPFIFNLGHGILPETPPENVARLAAVIRDWNEA